MDFIAIDVETAAPDPATICQIGIANFRDGQLVGKWSRLINPECDFHTMNMRVHRIKPEHVASEMVLRQILPTIAKALSGRIVVAHSAFDRAALRKAAARIGISEIDCKWLDSSRVARIAWPELTQSGYGLRNVCRIIGHSFAHHDAEADAEACGRVVLAAYEKTGLRPSEWLNSAYINLPAPAPRAEKLAAVINEAGHMFGHSIVLTGEFTYSRDEMITMACDAGCRVVNGVSRKTNMVIVGDGYASGSPFPEPWTGKYRKALALVAEGYPIRIVDELAFSALLRAKED